MISGHARDLHFSSTIVDTHSDSLARTVDDGDDLGTDTGRGHMDLPRMRAGNQTAQFFAAYVHPDYLEQGMAVQRVLRYTDAFRLLCERYPDQIEQARTASDVRRITGAGKLAGILCLEGGHAIMDDLAVLRELHALGIRYMTLTHNNTNNWADGVLDQPRHDGLSDYGREVVREMERVGVMVDISHVSVKTFWDAMETVTKPVIASHSSCWEICQNPRNMRDDQLRAVAKNGGVVHVNYEVTFVGQQRNVEETALNEQRDAEIADLDSRFEPGSPDAEKARKEISSRYSALVDKLARPNYTEIVDHIDRDRRGRGNRPRGARLRLRRLPPADRHGRLHPRSPDYRGAGQARVLRRGHPQDTGREHPPCHGGGDRRVGYGARSHSSRRTP